MKLLQVINNVLLVLYDWVYLSLVRRTAGHQLKDFIPPRDMRYTAKRISFCAIL